MQRAWTYVDDRRTHEVRVWIEPGGNGTLVIRESAFGGRDDREALIVRARLSDARDVRPHIEPLEERLSRLGSYQRAMVGGKGWAPLPRLAGLDLSPTNVPGYGASMEFHHFEAPGRAIQMTFVGLQMRSKEGPRHLFGRLESGAGEPTLHVLHARLPTPVYRSALAKEMLAIAQDGYSRVTTQGSPNGQDHLSWWNDVKAVIDGVIGRIKQGQFVPEGAWRPSWRDGRPKAKAPAAGVGLSLGTPSSPHGLTPAQERELDMKGRRSFHVEDEDTGRAKAVETKAPAALLDSTSADVMTILQDERLAALHARFLAAGEEATLVAGAEKELRAKLKEKRAAAPPHEQHLISLVEASLLLRRALTVKGARIEPEVMSLLRHAPAYL